MPLSDDQLITLVRRDGLLKPEQVRQAREASRMTGKPLLEIIRERRWLDDAEMALIEAAAAVVRPPGVPTAGSSATAIGSPADFFGDRPTAIPGVATDRDATVLAGEDSNRPTAAPALRGAVQPTSPRRAEPDPAAAPAAEPVAARWVYLLGALLAVVLLAAVVAGLRKFVRSARVSAPHQAPAKR